MLLDLPLDTRDLAGVSFGCLPGCGFCCLQPAEVSAPEAAALRARAPNVKIGFDGDRSFLRVAGGCGACQFLDAARQCTVYDARPNHCRWFPFHVYFGRRIEVVVNRSCPGVADGIAGASVEPQARAALATAEPEVVRRHVEESAATHAQFQANCEANGVWSDVDAAIADVLALGPAVFQRATLEGLAGAPARDLAAHALSAFEHGDAGKRPYLSAPDLAWNVFQRRGARIGVAQLSPSGRLDVRQVAKYERWEEPEAELAEELAPHFVALLGRESFAGSVFDTVDEHEYHMGVAEAARAEAAYVAVELSLRAQVLREIRPGADAAALAREARKFYDSDFLDRPAIGAWL